MCQHLAKIQHMAWKPKGVFCIGAPATRKAQLWRGLQRAEQVLWMLAVLGSPWELGLVLPCLCRHVEPALCGSSCSSCSSSAGFETQH